MKIAIPCENGEVMQHFGHATEFTVYTIEDIKPIEKETVTVDDTDHEKVAGGLKSRGVDLVICGNIGEGAHAAIDNAHMLLISGVTGNADEAVDSFLQGNLELMTGVYGHSAAECRALAHEMMDRLRLNEVANQRAKTLSGGWMRRLSIAMALVSSPRVLFLDEPTLGLDVLARRELWSVSRSLRGHTALVLTTHYLEEAEALSDRIGIMSHGHLIALGTAQELIEKAGESSFENAFIALAGEGDAAK